MKIGFDAKRLYCNATGLGNYSRTIVKNLSVLFPENEYHLYSPEIKDLPESTFFLNNPILKTHLPKSPFKALWRSYFVNKQFKRDQLDIYHGLSHEIPFGIRQTKIKSIVTIHDLIFKVIPETFPAIDRHIYNLKFRYSCQVADKVIAISESTKNDIVRFYNIDPAKIEVVYQSCNPLFFDVEPPVTMEETAGSYALPSQYLLYVGSVEERKDLKTLIRAMDLLPKGLKIPLVVIGRGKKYMQETKRLVNQLKLDKYVIWIEDLQNNQHLKTIYQNAEIFIYPSKYEGFGLPVIEALLSKTPVITTDSSSLPEAGGPDSFYFKSGNAEELSHGIEDVLTNENLRKNMAVKGYEYAIKKFNVKKTTRDLMDIYQTII
jgi:glycosyltransferase involved in cell wall biosynthesis